MESENALLLSAYAASPRGFAPESDMPFYTQEFLPAIESSGFLVRCPWTLTDQKLIERAKETERTGSHSQALRAWRRVNRIIGLNNELALNASDVVVAILNGMEPDGGSIAEAMVAYACGKKVFAYRSDFRIAGENIAAKVNMQVQYFIEQSGGAIVSTLAELERVLRKEFLRLSKE